jgi:transcriptional regulator of aromatic amino acid metabolism
MVLPSKQFEKIRLVSVPEDMAEQEAFQHATGIIARVEEQAEYTLEDIEDALEGHGFQLSDYSLGPEID